MPAATSPLVCIVVVNWNALDVTGECLQSLRALTYRNYEVYLVDNGSSDRSGELLSARFPEVHLLRLADNEGFTGGSNAGMRRALSDGADYILLLNNDTLVAEDLVDQLVGTAESDSTIAIENPKIYFMDPPDRIWYAAGSFDWWQGISFYHRKKRDAQTPQQVCEITFATGCAMFLRASALRQVGLFDERFFAYVEDADLTTRVLKSGHRAVYVPAGRVWHLDGYTGKRMMGMRVAVRLAVRNKFLLMMKHAKPWHWVTFLPCFGARRILFFALRGVRTGDLRSAWAPIGGVADFLRLAARRFSRG